MSYYVSYQLIYLDLNEFTYNNIANNNTTASNKNYNENYVYDKNAFEKIDLDFYETVIISRSGWVFTTVLESS